MGPLKKITDLCVRIIRRVCAAHTILIQISSLEIKFFYLSIKVSLWNRDTLDPRRPYMPWVCLELRFHPFFICPLNLSDTSRFASDRRRPRHKTRAHKHTHKHTHTHSKNTSPHNTFLMLYSVITFNYRQICPCPNDGAVILIIFIYAFPQSALLFFFYFFSSANIWQLQLCFLVASIMCLTSRCWPNTIVCSVFVESTVDVSYLPFAMCMEHISSLLNTLMNC